VQEYIIESEPVAPKEHNLAFYDLVVAYIIIGVILFFTVPVIHIKNQTYYISRDIAELRTKKDILDEENKNLRRELELLRYKNEILDPFEVRKGE